VTLRSHFLWPFSESPRLQDIAGPACASSDVENLLKALYPEAEPVLFSSARAGLSAVLQVIELSRPDLLWTPEFSSHCVLESVAHVCTPTPVPVDGMAAALVYHQWGIRHTESFDSPVHIIEDAVDALLLPGRNPFRTRSDFVIWSLPKVLGSLGGGVVFCRKGGDAQSLRLLRNQRGSSLLQALLRWSSKYSIRATSYWTGAEAMQGELVAPLRRQAMRLLSSLNELAAERLAVMRGLSVALAESFERSGSLPSNLPLRLPVDCEALWSPSGPMSAGLRFFNLARQWPQARWERVAPLPIHRDVGVDDIRRFSKHIHPEIFINE